MLLITYTSARNSSFVDKLKTCNTRRLWKQMQSCLELFIMRPSSLGGGRIMRRTLSVRLSVRPSRYRYRASRRAT